MLHGHVSAVPGVSVCVSGCVRAHLHHCRPVCRRMRLYLQMCVTFCVCVEVFVRTEKSRREVQFHSQNTNNESRRELQLQELQGLIVTLYYIYFL